MSLKYIPFLLKCYSFKKCNVTINTNMNSRLRKNQEFKLSFLVNGHKTKSIDFFHILCWKFLSFLSTGELKCNSDKNDLFFLCFALHNYVWLYINDVTASRGRRLMILWRQYISLSTKNYVKGGRDQKSKNWMTSFTDDYQASSVLWF